MIPFKNMRNHLYDNSDSFPSYFDHESDGIPFVSYSTGKLSQRSYSFECESNHKSKALRLDRDESVKWRYITPLNKLMYP